MPPTKLLQGSSLYPHQHAPQDRTGQDRTGQDRTGQDRTGQDRTGQDRTGQDRTGQDRTGQDKTRQDKTDSTHERWVQPKSLIKLEEHMATAKKPCYSTESMRCWHVAPRVHTVVGQCVEEAEKVIRKFRSAHRTDSAKKKMQRWSTVTSLFSSEVCLLSCF